MRLHLVPLAFAAALVLPMAGQAQVYRPTDPPRVTAAGESWAAEGTPVTFLGETYEPGGATVFFNGNTMVMVGEYRGVPLYVDTTQGGRTGYLVEFGDSRQIFEDPKHLHTQQYIRGEFS